MFDSSLHIQNKIITRESLLAIFDRMYQEIQNSKQIAENEKNANERFSYEYQEWTRKDYDGRLRFTVYSTDNNSITYENYQDFRAVFNTRAASIKSFYAYFSTGYFVQPKGAKSEYITQHINLIITETKMDIDVAISSKDPAMGEIYQLISTIIMEAPEKFDKIIKQKDLISTKIGSSVAFIPVSVVATGLLFVDFTRKFLLDYFWAFPLAVLVLTGVVGILIGTARTGAIYNKLIPDKKYAGYDINSGRSMYNDDMNTFQNSGEVLIGERTNNMELRAKLTELNAKSGKMILVELGVLAVLSVIVAIMHFVIK